MMNAVAAAIQQHGASPLVSQAVWLGVAQGALLVLMLTLRAVEQFSHQLLQMQLSNRISIMIMAKATSLDIQHFEDDQLHDTLQRAMRESAMRPFQVFTALSGLGSQILALCSVATVLLNWNWMVALI